MLQDSTETALIDLSTDVQAKSLQGASQQETDHYLYSTTQHSTARGERSQRLKQKNIQMQRLGFPEDSVVVSSREAGAPPPSPAVGLE